MKKALSIILAGAMALSLSVPALAAGGDQELTGNPTEGQTTVHATTKVRNPEYTVKIPKVADFDDHNALAHGRGYIMQGDEGSVPINFSVALCNAKYFNGKVLVVKYHGEGENGELVMKNEDGVELPFYVQESTSHPNWSVENGIFSVLEQNKNSEGAGGWGYGRNLRVDVADITAAGDYSGIMYFDFEIMEPDQVPGATEAEA